MFAHGNNILCITAVIPVDSIYMHHTDINYFGFFPKSWFLFVYIYVCILVSWFYIYTAICTACQMTVM